MVRKTLQSMAASCRPNYRCCLAFTILICIVEIIYLQELGNGTSSLLLPSTKRKHIINDTNSISTPSLPSSPKMFPSGWDDRAIKIYHTSLRACITRAFNDTAAVRDVKVGPFSSSFRAAGSWLSCRSSSWWNNIVGMSPKWEPQTFKTYFEFIDSDTILIDFGTWIGPTILYGVQMANKAYGIEADPASYAIMRFNMKLNVDRYWYSNIHIQPACVGTRSDTQNEKNGLMTMRSKGAGNSASGIGKKIVGTAHVEWNVQCYTLKYLIDEWGIWNDIMYHHKKLFIKIDVESYECSLVPDLYYWLKMIPTKKQLPTFFISYHPQIMPEGCTDQQYLGLAKIVKLYSFVRCDPYGPQQIEFSVAPDTTISTIKAKIKSCAINLPTSTFVLHV